MKNTKSPIKKPALIKTVDVMPFEMKLERIEYSKVVVDFLLQHDYQWDAHYYRSNRIPIQPWISLSSFGYEGVIYRDRPRIFFTADAPGHENYLSFNDFLLRYVSQDEACRGITQAPEKDIGNALIMDTSLIDICKR